MSNWTGRVGELRELADELYSTATCTAREYVALNPDEGAREYAEAILDMNQEPLDANERRIVLGRLTQLAEDDLA